MLEYLVLVPKNNMKVVDYYGNRLEVPAEVTHITTDNDGLVSGWTGSPHLIFGSGFWSDYAQVNSEVQLGRFKVSEGETISTEEAKNSLQIVE